MEKDCLFCKIINKEIPSDFIYENDRVVVFRDINPQAPVHLLIVPKKHIRSINDIIDEDLGVISEMIMTARDMAKKESVAESGYKLFFNVEKGGGQIIFHLHLHLIGGWNQAR
ncbi:MAG: histidine triad nucleotide-binding protein [Desulfosarcina sp.]|nr:histidine triad nucleotide-binding protein [Desulfobacterales bacterium]